MRLTPKDVAQEDDKKTRRDKGLDDNKKPFKCKSCCLKKLQPLPLPGIPKRKSVVLAGIEIRNDASSSSPPAYLASAKATDRVEGGSGGGQTDQGGGGGGGQAAGGGEGRGTKTEELNGTKRQLEFQGSGASASRLGEEARASVGGASVLAMDSPAVGGAAQTSVPCKTIPCDQCKIGFFEAVSVANGLSVRHRCTCSAVEPSLTARLFVSRTQRHLTQCLVSLPLTTAAVPSWKEKWGLELGRKRRTTAFEMEGNVEDEQAGFLADMA